MIIPGKLASLGINGCLTRNLEEAGVHSLIDGG